jgi:hypothetical protein
MNLTDKIHKILFPSKASEIEDLFSREIEALQTSKKWKELSLEFKEKLDVQPTMADLMRDVLGLPMIDVVKVGKDVAPKHFLEGLSPKSRLQKLARLKEAAENPVLQEVMSYWMNRHGNLALRTSPLENKKMEAAIFSINGISCIRKELTNAIKEVKEGREPPKPFDKHQVVADLED